MSTLHHKISSESVEFWVEIDGGKLPLEQWAISDPMLLDGKPANVAHLIGLVDEERASFDQGALSVPNEEVANFELFELRGIGLPDPVPFRLELAGQGLISLPNFHIRYGWVSEKGRVQVGYVVNGLFLEKGDQRFVLSDPYYELIRRIDRLNKAGTLDQSDRFDLWADVSELLPDDAKVDNTLAPVKVIRVDSFTVDTNENFDLVPMPIRTRPVGDEGLGELSPELLPPEMQKALADQFSGYTSVRRLYTVPGGYVRLSKSLEKALSVVHKLKDEPIERRRSFIENPEKILQQSLEGVIDPEAISQIFQETEGFISQRVEKFGVWEPTLSVYIQPSQISWLPGEEGPDEQKPGLIVTIPLPNAVVQVSSSEVPYLAKIAEEALSSGQGSLEFQGQKIEVSPDSVEMLRKAAEGIEKINVSSGKTPEKDKPEYVGPIIRTNFEDPQYVLEKKPRKLSDTWDKLPEVLSRGTIPLKHQKACLNWLKEHWASGSTGALLADDMGLGKTLQTLLFLAWVSEEMEKGSVGKMPHLIVAPTGLLKNWMDEEQKHLQSPGLGGLFPMYGSRANTFGRQSRRERLEELSEVGCVLTTYETLRDKINDIFVGVKWGVVVFDEAQKIKNPGSRMTEMAKAINAEFTLALTGTPVENRLSDVWSIIDATNPGHLGSLKEFNNKYNVESNSDAPKELSFNLQADKPPIMLRRMKDEGHLDGLPEKCPPNLVQVKMPKQQADAYVEEVSKAKSSAGNKGAMLGALQSIKKVSLYSGELPPGGLTDEFVSESARLSAMVSVLDGVAQRNEKALIFVEPLNLQEQLVTYLQKRYGLRRPPFRISGQVSGHKRKDYVDAFQDGQEGEFDAMILSPKAGGVGLTLTKANNVIHLTRWWNPAVEDQCTDRVFRIGQNKPVNVYIPMAIHPTYGDASFDVNLHNLLESKRSLSHTALASPEASQRDMEKLFGNTISN
jgi:SNF2 family DNA or RNA helicase